MPELVEQALRQAAPRATTSPCWPSSGNRPKTRLAAVTGVSTQSLGDEVFASTIQASMLGDKDTDDMDEAEIERSIREINEAIKRSSAKRR